jgi:hypothetical protein
MEAYVCLQKTLLGVSRDDFQDVIIYVIGFGHLKKIQRDIFQSAGRIDMDGSGSGPENVGNNDA